MQENSLYTNRIMKTAVTQIKTSESILYRDLGYMEYQEAWDFQKDFQAKRIARKDNDTLFLVEHEPVYTLGKNADADHILGQASDSVKVFQIERGGDVTFHGPGQLVGYPIIDLHNYKTSVSWYMRTLEKVLINTLFIFGIEADRKEGLTGVWVEDEKIAALGVRVSRWVTMHGFALNVSTDLSFYNGIIPCGIFEYGITSMEKLLKKSVPMDTVKKELVKQFRILFDQEKFKG